jgi:hypothetical protein
MPIHFQLTLRAFEDLPILGLGQETASGHSLGVLLGSTEAVNATPDILLRMLLHGVLWFLFLLALYFSYNSLIPFLCAMAFFLS